MTDWTFADTWESVAQVRPDSPSQIHAGVHRSWQSFDRRANGVAAALIESGLSHQSKVAQYLYNTPEYLESFYASLKAGLAPVNTNYRYTEDELTYLWDNAEVEAVVYDGAFVANVSKVRERLASVRLWLQVGDGEGGAGVPSWAVPYDEVAAAGPTEPVRGPWGRSGDDLILIYTGGTTGMPKGVMWRQDDLWAILNRTASLRYPEDGSYADVREALLEPSKRAPARLLPGPPLMHGTGLFTAMSTLSSGGSIVLPEGRGFSAEVMLEVIERDRVSELAIVGDAFARPLLAALDANPGRWDLSSLWLIVSSGVMWSAEVRAGLLRHNPKLMLVDTLGSSEAIGMARSRTTGDGQATTGGFRMSEDTQVIADDGSFVQPGTGQRGMVALRGRGPVGYYRDEEKSASTFRIVGGERWTIPGDYAEIEADGAIRLLGRGSVCINTGGEKVFPEEVEEVLKRHPSVADAVVVGVPDERFGEIVVALVEPEAGGALDHPDLVDWAKSSLAAYKAPKRIVPVPTVGRAVNGKVDYRGLRLLAMSELGIAT